ncbi:two-component response regulator [Legionella sainthelensi]|uniref:Two-component response regulator n=1 Tax=Legionella sainthelensi TaxID=28087 RepID=A0A0W0YJX7_9GAMM|nr:response regulator [Legionella sainthelensi]KTD56883.1 two-component response regulator [Legionella sainthelensi]VEH37134.1 two-component response regulator [Legionella sainthelensi]
MHKELKKILYAEDEEDIRAIAQIALEEIGDFTVRYCSNGKEVIDAAKEFIPDLLLLDVMMPEQDGPTTLCELRKNPEFMEIPAIFMTAKIQSDEIAEYKSIGAIDVIKKPFDPLTLAMSINNAWLKYNG